MNVYIKNNDIDSLYSRINEVYQIIKKRNLLTIEDIESDEDIYYQNFESEMPKWFLNENYNQNTEGFKGWRFDFWLELMIDSHLDILNIRKIDDDILIKLDVRGIPFLKNGFVYWFYNSGATKITWWLNENEKKESFSLEPEKE